MMCPATMAEAMSEIECFAVQPCPVRLAHGVEKLAGDRHRRGVD
jgi:hypothetical protein